MADVEKYLVFLCSGAAKAGNKKLSYRIASALTAMGAADIGTLQNLSEQHSLAPHLQRRMIFINDCRSGCVNVLTHGFNKDNYTYIDVSAYIGTKDLDVERYVIDEILPKIKVKWLHSINDKFVADSNP
jgi:uncharacterized metal-binding protein